MEGYADAAPLYRERGHEGVLPLPGASKQHPPKGFTGRTGAMPDDAQIEKWIKTRKRGNICLRPAHGVLGIDLDLYKDADARAKLEELADEALPDTWCSSARDDGSGIYWYTVPSEIERWKDAPVEGIETVHFGHRYGIVWPSVHPDTGTRYVWHGPRDDIPAPDEYTELPAAYVELLRADKPASNGSEPKPAKLRLVGGEADDAERYMANVCAELAEMGAESGRNNRLNTVAFDLAKNGIATGRLTAEAVEAALWAASEANGLVADTGGASVRATIASGLEAGRAAYGGGGSGAAGTAPDGYRLTDVGNSLRLVDLVGNRIKYVHRWKAWLVYRHKGVWELDSGATLVRELAKGVAHEVRRQAKAVTDHDEHARLWTWAKQCESASRIRAMVDLACGIESVLIDHNDLDPDPELLNVKNGTVNLRTGALQEHDPNDLCTLQCNASYDPDAEAPLWESCLRTWQPKAELRDYLQLEAGAAATGRPTETLSIHYGTGGNGKTKFSGALQWALGDYHVVPHKSLLVVQKHAQHETVKASLFRKRYAATEETSASDRLNEDQVKHLTGGGSISARRMREDEWTFEPTHTMVLHTNNKPKIKGTDESVWRRLRLVPWSVTIPLKDRDTLLPEKLKKEADGILAWIVRGAQTFLAGDFTVPALVRSASDEYRSEQDTVARFLDEEFEFGERVWLPVRVLVARAEEWATAAGVFPSLRMADIAPELERRGCVRRHTKKGAVWGGLRLRSDAHGAVTQGTLPESDPL